MSFFLRFLKLNASSINKYEEQIESDCLQLEEVKCNDLEERIVHGGSLDEVHKLQKLYRRKTLKGKFVIYYYITQVIVI